MSYNDESLLIRALNATRQSYFPTYIGLRLIGDQITSGENKYLERVVVRRLASGDPWRFKRFNLYKASARTHGIISHEYRKCLAPSPITAVAEACVLALLSADPVFRVSDRVYSYRWPKTPRSSGNYDYFVKGYAQRNSEIAEALTKPDSVAVVTDIKSFYPSVEKEQIDAVLRAMLARAHPITHNSLGSVSF